MARSSQYFIPSIMLPSGDITSDLHSLQQAFCDYFAALYNLAPLSSPVDLDSFSHYIQDYVQEIAIPKLDEDSGNSLDALFLYEELLDAITNTPWGKSPGPEGLASKSYKTYKEYITPFMHICY